MSREQRRDTSTASSKIFKSAAWKVQDSDTISAWLFKFGKTFRKNTCTDFLEVFSVIRSRLVREEETQAPCPERDESFDPNIAQFPDHFSFGRNSYWGREKARKMEGVIYTIEARHESPERHIEGLIFHFGEERT